MGRKTFYTERDIENLVGQGITKLTINDDVVLTDLACERANKLGFVLVEGSSHPIPAQGTSAGLAANDLAAKVKATVLARMGDSVSEELLDAIIPKVLAQFNLDKE